MRKVALASLFLFSFNSQYQKIDALPYVNEEQEIKRRINNNETIKNISYVVKENEKIGLNWSDNMPIYSPIKVSDITHISDLFGFRKDHPVLHIPKFHFGIDICAELGTPVHSVAKGIVEKVQSIKHGYGNNVTINHGDGYKTKYAHLNEIFVKEGDIVNLEDVIGTVGSTGMSTGNHLHYEIILNNKPINPLSFYFEDISEKNSNDYIKVLSELEVVKDQLLTNNKSHWKQTGVSI